MTEIRALDAALLRDFPLPTHKEDGDKEDRGRLLLVAGSAQLPGAALLAGVAALRAGAGKLQILTAGSIAAPLGVAVPEARVIGLEESGEGCLAESAIEPMLRWAADARAMTLGCGLQHGRPLDALLDALLASGLGLPLVLDAAVLGSLAERAEALRARAGGSVLLPHAREMARLLRCEPDEVIADPLAAARAASERFGCVVVIKGARSFIVEPDGGSYRFEGGGIGLATSGSGDVLAGIVGGLCARGADPLTATLWGVWLHGESGRQLARTVGRIGFLAREIPDLIPRLMERY